MVVNLPTLTRETLVLQRNANRIKPSPPLLVRIQSPPPNEGDNLGGEDNDICDGDHDMSDEGGDMGDEDDDLTDEDYVHLPTDTYPEGPVRRNLHNRNKVWVCAPAARLERRNTESMTDMTLSYRHSRGTAKLAFSVTRQTPMLSTYGHSLSTTHVNAAIIRGSACIVHLPPSVRR